MATATVRPDVSGCLYDYTTRRWTVLDHARTWDADDPLVTAHPEVFVVEKPKPAPKKKGGD